MKKNVGLSVYLLSFFGIALIGIGTYFFFFRPELLAEDVRFMGLNENQENILKPLLAPWLKQVFRVMGGYIASSGVLIIYLASTSFRRFEKGAWLTTLLAGFFSIVVMTTINFKIESDFKWPILALGVFWFSALAFNFIEKRNAVPRG